MRIGFISGDVVEVSNERKSVSVPDYPVQGHLIRKWMEHGHEVVLLTRHPKLATPPDGVVYDPGGDPREHSLDVLFGDRLGRLGSEWEENTMWQLEQHVGPIVFHQYVAYTGWSPPFRGMPWLLGHERDWTIINRSPDPRRAFFAMIGFDERPPDNGTVRFETWGPWFMREYPWGGEHVTPDLIGAREFLQGYYGRVPRGEKRGTRIRQWMSAGDWSRVIFGPVTSTAWIAQETGAHDGGRVLHRDVPQMLTRFTLTVHVPAERLRNKGTINIWPHRIVECALSGVLQLFDVEMGLRDFAAWRVMRPNDLREWARRARDVEFVAEEVRKQQEIVLPRTDPDEAYRKLEGIMNDAIARYRG